MGRHCTTRRQHPAGADPYRRGYVDGCRCVPRWPNTGVRTAGRHLHHADHGRNANPCSGRSGMGSTAAVFTRWPPHRLHLRQGRRRQHLDHECRWFGQAPADQGGFPPHQSGKLVARRQLYRRQEAFHHPAFARHRRDLDLPCFGWGRCPAGEAGERHLAKGTGRARLFAQWRCGILFAQRHIRADFRICAGFHAGNLRHRALRPGNRRSDDSRERLAARFARSLRPMARTSPLSAGTRTRPSSGSRIWRAVSSA